MEPVRFVRELNRFPSFPGEEPLTVRFESRHQPVLFCYLEHVYDGEQLRPVRLQVGATPLTVRQRQCFDGRQRVGRPDAAIAWAPSREWVTEMTAPDERRSAGSALA